MQATFRGLAVGLGFGGALEGFSAEKPRDVAQLLRLW